MASDIEILIGLLQETKKDIITVVNAQTSAVSDEVKRVNDTVIKQNSRIGKLEDRAGELERITRERGLTCYKTLEELKPSRDLVRSLDWIFRNKKISIGVIISTLFIVQSFVYFIFKYGGVIKLIENFYK